MSSSAAFYKQVGGCEVSHIPDGYMVHQAEPEKVHYLNPTAAIVYELCDGAQSVTAIANFLQSNFSLPEPPVAEVQDCIASLLVEGLIAPC